MGVVVNLAAVFTDFEGLGCMQGRATLGAGKANKGCAVFWQQPYFKGITGGIFGVTLWTKHCGTVGAAQGIDG